MIVVCSQCTTRLQLDDAKVPARAFTIRCPKCQNVINAKPPSADAAPDSEPISSGNNNGSTHGVVAESAAPPDQPRFKPPSPAPAFNPDGDDTEADVQAYTQPTAVENNDVVRMLAAVLQRGGLDKERHGGGAAVIGWERRRALVCVTPGHREALARQLASSNYQVFIADDTSQAIERMREDHMHVVILDPGFDPIEQGSAFVTREVNIMRPGERRRLFFVHLSASARTLDSHAAFVNNVNMVINPADIENTAQLLERALRDFNELYREFNHVQSAATTSI